MLHNIAQKYRIQLKKNRRDRNELFFLTKAVLFMAIVEPLMTVPQVYEVWVNRQTAGVSLATWTFMFIASITWTAYSIKIKNIPMLIGSLIWAITEGLVVIGLIIF